MPKAHDKVEALLKDDPEALQMWRAATTAKKGGDRKSDNAIKRDNVTNDPERGNAKAYTLDRLKRERKDLFDEVVAGNLSANAAAIQAGFRKPGAEVAATFRHYTRVPARDKVVEEASYAGEAGSLRKVRWGA